MLSMYEVWLLNNEAGAGTEEMHQTPWQSS